MPMWVPAVVNKTPERTDNILATCVVTMAGYTCDADFIKYVIGLVGQPKPVVTDFESYVV
jgi:hypothetical protein